MALEIHYQGESDCRCCDVDDCSRTLQILYFSGCEDLTSSKWDSEFPHLTCARYDRGEIVHSEDYANYRVKDDEWSLSDGSNVAFSYRPFSNSKVANLSMTVDLIDPSLVGDLSDLSLAKVKKIVFISGGGTIEDYVESPGSIRDEMGNSVGVAVFKSTEEDATWNFYMDAGVAKMDFTHSLKFYSWDPDTATRSLDNQIDSAGTYAILPTNTGFEVFRSLISGDSAPSGVGTVEGVVGGFNTRFEPNSPPSGSTYTQPLSTVPEVQFNYTRVVNDVSVNGAGDETTTTTRNNAKQTNFSRVLVNSIQAKYLLSNLDDFQDVPVVGQINTLPGGVITPHEGFSLTVDFLNATEDAALSEILSFSYAAESCLSVTDVDHDCLPQNLFSVTRA